MTPNWSVVSGDGRVKIYKQLKKLKCFNLNEIDVRLSDSSSENWLAFWISNAECVRARFIRFVHRRIEEKQKQKPTTWKVQLKLDGTNPATRTIVQISFMLGDLWIFTVFPFNLINPIGFWRLFISVRVHWAQRKIELDRWPMIRWCDEILKKAFRIASVACVSLHSRGCPESARVQFQLWRDFSQGEKSLIIKNKLRGKSFTFN